MNGGSVEITKKNIGKIFINTLKKYDAGRGCRDPEQKKRQKINKNFRHTVFNFQVFYFIHIFHFKPRAGRRQQNFLSRDSLGRCKFFVRDYNSWQ